MDFVVVVVFLLVALLFLKPHHLLFFMIFLICCVLGLDGLFPYLPIYLLPSGLFLKSILPSV